MKTGSFTLTDCCCCCCMQQIACGTSASFKDATYSHWQLTMLPQRFSTCCQWHAPSPCLHPI